MTESDPIPLDPRYIRDDTGQCLVCGRDGATEVWHDADGSGWWVHVGC